MEELPTYGSKKLQFERILYNIYKSSDYNVFLSARVYYKVVYLDQAFAKVDLEDLTNIDRFKPLYKGLAFTKERTN